MFVLPRVAVFAATLVVAGAASAAATHLDWPTCAALGVQKDGPRNFTVVCASGPAPAAPPTVVIDLPQCPSVAVWGRGEALRIECPAGDTTVIAGNTPMVWAVYGCADVSVWGGSDRASVDCVADIARRRVQEAYVAYYGRPGDPAGINYWASRLVAAGGVLDSLIDAFGNSQEFRSRYGGLDNTALVTKVFQQALGRDPEPGGLAYYVDRLGTGASTLGSIALNVVDGAQSGDATVVANRLHVADHFTGRAAAGCSYGSPGYGASLITPIMTTNASVATAIAIIDNHCGT
jgi:hypothetical protein